MEKAFKNKKRSGSESSFSESSSRSNSSARIKIKDRGIKQTSREKSKQRSQQKSKRPQTHLNSNKGLLGKLIGQNIRTNQRMDRNEVLKAEQKLADQGYSGPDAKVKLMTQVLNQNQNDQTDIKYDQEHLRAEQLASSFMANNLNLFSKSK